MDRRYGSGRVRSVGRPVVPRSRPAPGRADCHLYRFYVRDPRSGYDGRTLGYIGETVRMPFERLMEHVRDQPWADTIVSWEVDDRVYCGKEDVLDAEREAVRRERPLYNHEWNLDNPDRVEIWLAREQRAARDADRCFEAEDGLADAAPNDWSTGPDDESDDESDGAVDSADDAGDSWPSTEPDRAYRAPTRRIRDSGRWGSPPRLPRRWERRINRALLWIAGWAALAGAAWWLLHRYVPMLPGRTTRIVAAVAAVLACLVVDPRQWRRQLSRWRRKAVRVLTGLALVALVGLIGWLTLVATHPVPRHGR